jgi:hypothetical protein
MLSIEEALLDVLELWYPGKADILTPRYATNCSKECKDRDIASPPVSHAVSHILQHIYASQGEQLIQFQYIMKWR